MALTIANLNVSCPLYMEGERVHVALQQVKWSKQKNHIHTPKSLYSKSKSGHAMKHCRTIPTQYRQMEQHMATTTGILCKPSPNRDWSLNTSPVQSMEHYPLSANSEKPNEMFKVALSKGHILKVGRLKK